jgi:hypothetical protein
MNVWGQFHLKKPIAGVGKLFEKQFSISNMYCTDKFKFIANWQGYINVSLAFISSGFE